MAEITEADIAELAERRWDSLTYLQRDSLKAACQAIRVDAERSGMRGSGQRWSAEAGAIFAHLRQLVETCIDQLATEQYGVAARLRDQSYWRQVERVVLARSTQWLRGTLGALENEAAAQGAGGNVVMAFLLQQQQVSANVANRISTRTQELALQDRLSTISDARGSPTNHPDALAQMGDSFDVAFSFAGEDRKYVEDVAEALKANGVSVFYDRFERGLRGT